jgi:SAM-dependent methyltransferase
MNNKTDYSPEFYRNNAHRFAEVAHNNISNRYTSKSHPDLTDDLVLMERLRELVPLNSYGLDAGCGPGARDVFLYRKDGYNVIGVDVVEENIQIAKKIHPEIADYVFVADLSQALNFSSNSFDFVLCNAVIQHIRPDKVFNITIPELVRILKQWGILQFMFKEGEGIKTVYDDEYKVERSFHLYKAKEIIEVLNRLSVSIVPLEGKKIGGVMRFIDIKPMEHCVFFARKL